MIITSTGKPIALLTDITGSTAEDEVRIDAAIRGALAVSKLRETAQKKGISRMRQKDVEAEIFKSRKKR